MNNLSSAVVLIFLSGRNLLPLCARVSKKTYKSRRSLVIVWVFSHGIQMMAYTFLYSFVSIVSTTIIESFTYNRIRARALFHFTRNSSQFARQQRYVTGIPLDVKSVSAAISFSASREVWPNTTILMKRSIPLICLAAILLMTKGLSGIASLWMRLFFKNTATKKQHHLIISRLAILTSGVWTQARQKTTKQHRNHRNRE